MLQIESTNKMITKASSKEKMAVRLRPACHIRILKRSPLVELQLFTIPSSETVIAEVPSDESTAETTACCLVKCETMSGFGDSETPVSCEFLFIHILDLS